MATPYLAVVNLEFMVAGEGHVTVDALERALDIVNVFHVLHHVGFLAEGGLAHLARKCLSKFMITTLHTYRHT